MAVVVHLEENGEVHAHLKESTDPELHRSLSQQEVAGLESVSTGPHQHHLNTGGTGSESQRVLLKSGDVRMREADQNH